MNLLLSPIGGHETLMVSRGCHTFESPCVRGDTAHCGARG